MKKKSFFLILLLLINIGFALILNFQEFLMGSRAIKNFFVTFVYFAIWVIVYIISIKTKNRRILKFYSLFWLFTLFVAILTFYSNVSETTVNGGLPFAILVLTQWYGIDYFVDNYLITLFLISFISLIMFVTSVVFNWKCKQA